MKKTSNTGFYLRKQTISEAPTKSLLVSSICIEVTRRNFFILIIRCWCSAKDREKAERIHSCILSKKLWKKLLFNYSQCSVNTPEQRKLFTVINVPEENCLLWSIYKTKVVHSGQCTKRKLCTASWSVEYTGASCSLCRGRVVPCSPWIINIL